MPSLLAERTEPYKALGRNIFIAVVFVSLIPLLVFGGAIRYQFQTSYTEKVQAYLDTLVKKHGQNIDTFLLERQANIASLAAAYSFERLSDSAFLQEQLVRFQKAYGQVITDLGVVTADGRQVSYAGPFQLAQADYAQAEWFQRAIQVETFTSDVFLGLRGLPHFIVSVRGTGDGAPWLLRATIDFLAFNDLVESIQIGRTGMAFILNRKGELQTQTKRPLSDIQYYSRIFEDRRGAGDDMLFGHRQDAAGRDTIYVARRLKGGEWALVFQQDDQDAYADLYRARWMALVISILGGLAIVTMAFLLARRTVERLSRADQEKEMLNQQVIESGHLASLGELAAGIAHEINNPVAIMVEEAGWIEDLLEEEEFKASANLEEFTRSLQQIRKQGIRCRDITHKLLSFARRSDSRVGLVEVNDLVKEVVSLSSQQARYSNIAFELDLAPELPPVQVSQTELQQVLFNLIHNAIDAMEKQGGTIGIRSWASGGQVHFEVRDNGPGIPEANLNRIFEPFFTTKPVGKGTGLGLSICYGIVKKMKGEITVESTVGRGTSFQIDIPAAPAEPEAAGRAAG
jgi:two-component system NtrC family sensor kinase